MSMEEYIKKIRSLTDTPFGYTLSMIGGKWRLGILYWLFEKNFILNTKPSASTNFSAK